MVRLKFILTLCCSLVVFSALQAQPLYVEASQDVQPSYGPLWSRGPQAVSSSCDGENQDHVLVSDDFYVLDYTVLTYSYWSEEKPSAEAPMTHKQRFPSGHYPIGIHLNFRK